MSEAPLPPVYESMLDEDALRALLRDLSELEGPLEIAVKRGPVARGEQQPSVSLDEVFRLITGGEVRAVQLRYVHEQKLWCDTLIASPAGTRVVRMEVPRGSD